MLSLIFQIISIIIIIYIVIKIQNLFFGGIILVVSAVVIYVLFEQNKNKEKWSNTYSGWPGPLENPYQSNIPASYGNPKYMSTCKYKYTSNSNSNYLPMKNLP
jgi:hypothetical protein